MTQPREATLEIAAHALGVTWDRVVEIAAALEGAGLHLLAAGDIPPWIVQQNDNGDLLYLDTGSRRPNYRNPTAGLPVSPYDVPLYRVVPS